MNLTANTLFAANTLTDTSTYIGVILFAFIVGLAISITLLVILFSRLKAITEQTRRTANECEIIKKVLLNLEEMYADQNGFELVERKSGDDE